MENGPNSIVALVITYNRKILLEECLDKLLHQSLSSLDIIVIDNNSDDGTDKLVKNKFNNKRVKYFNTGKNLGGAGGFNYGLKKGMQLGYDYFWLMDDDSIPQENALSTLISASKKIKQNYGFLCSRVEWIDRTPCKMNIPDISNDWINENRLLKEGIVPVTRATFVGFFVSRGVVEEVGYPIKEFFIWSDDSNYCLRINNQYNSYMISDSIITHKMKSNDTASIITDNSNRNSRYFFAYRNRFYNARAIKKRGKYLLELLTTTIHIFTRSKHKFKKIFFMYKGFFSGLFFNPNVEYYDEHQEDR